MLPGCVHINLSPAQCITDRLSFHKAMDLISLAQQGTEVSRENYTAALDTGIPLPRMAGLEVLSAEPPATALPWDEMAHGGAPGAGPSGQAAYGGGAYPPVSPSIRRPQVMHTGGDVVVSLWGALCAAWA